MIEPASSGPDHGRDAEFFVYYRIHQSVALEAAALVRQFQQSLCAQHSGLEARLLRRPEAIDELQTWMETYRFPPVGASPALQAEIAALARPLARLTTGERHCEVFMPCA